MTVRRAILSAPELLYRARDVAEHRVDLGADAAHCSDGGNRDQRTYERVFDGSRAGLVLHEPQNEGRHDVAPGRPRFANEPFSAAAS